MMVQTLIAVAVAVVALDLAVLSVSKISEDGVESMNRHLERGRKRGLIQVIEDGVMTKAMIAGENIKRSQRRRSHPIDIENETMK